VVVGSLLMLDILTIIKDHQERRESRIVKEPSAGSLGRRGTLQGVVSKEWRRGKMVASVLLIESFSV
jgi:hypothetical protein